MHKYDFSYQAMLNQRLLTLKFSLGKLKFAIIFEHWDNFNDMPNNRLIVYGSILMIIWMAKNENSKMDFQQKCNSCKLVFIV